MLSSYHFDLGAVRAFLLIIISSGIRAVIVRKGYHLAKLGIDILQ